MPTFEVSMTVEEGGKKKTQYTLDSDLNGEVTLQEFLEYSKRVLILTADQILREEQAKGFDKKPVIAVDGRFNKPVTAVKPLGEITFYARQTITDIVLEAYDGLLKRSKVDTGRYKSSHYVFLNGKQVATDEPSLKNWVASKPDIKDKDLIRIVNIQPYARKLERYGVTAGRTASRFEKRRKETKGASSRVRSPNGTYFLTARSIKAKYKMNSFIKFSFISGSSLGISGAFTNGPRTGRHKSSSRKGKNSAGRAYLYPSLLISVQQRGILDV